MKRPSVITTAEEAHDLLTAVNEKFSEIPFYEMNKELLEREDFKIFPAAVKWHQVFDGGLIVHTAQVWAGALGMLAGHTNVRLDLLFTAILWHDFGKLFDYERRDTPITLENGKISNWKTTDHYKMVKHLPMSYHQFLAHCDKHGLASFPPNKDVLHICHMILSHHGRNEWGSPVKPETTEAWALHAADMLSSQYTED